eukprot:5233907-Prymnesium_polylepis.1
MVRARRPAALSPVHGRRHRDLARGGRVLEGLQHVPVERAARKAGADPDGNEQRGGGGEVGEQPRQREGMDRAARHKVELHAKVLHAQAGGALGARPLLAGPLGARREHLHAPRVVHERRARHAVLQVGKVQSDQQPHAILAPAALRRHDVLPRAGAAAAVCLRRRVAALRAKDVALDLRVGAQHALQRQSQRHQVVGAPREVEAGSGDERLHEQLEPLGSIHVKVSCH